MFIQSISSNFILSKIDYNKNKSAEVSFCRFKGKKPSKSILSDESLIRLEVFKQKYNFKKQKPLQWAMKRAIDIAGASVGLVLSAPIIILAGSMIKVESKGPVIYKQMRVGRYGKEFKIYKIRTMEMDSLDNIEKTINKIKNQNELKINPPDMSKITKMGTKLRKLSLDELPQFFNILKGDMSLVGPRPLLLEEIKVMECHYPDSVRRFVLRPGAQLPYRTPKTQRIAQNLALEKKYLDNWSLKTDIKYLFSIIKEVLKAKNY